MAKVFLETGDDYKVVNANTTVFGAIGDDTDSVIIETGTTGVTVNGNVDRVDFAGNLADFMFVAGFGANMSVYAADGTTLLATIPIQEDANGTQLVFADGAVASIFADGAVTTGGEALTTTPAAITPAAEAIDTDTTTAANVTPPAVTASFSIADVSVAEADGTATFTVTLSDAPGAGESLTVDYATSDGTGTAGTDYTAVPATTLTFGEGVTTQTFTVAIAEDALVEADETFTVTLSNPTGSIGENIAVIADATATGTITNDDVAVEIASYTVTPDAVSVTEGNDVVFTVTALDVDGNPAAVAADTTFNYQMAGAAAGTVTAADPESDLGKITGSVTILAGQSTGTFTVTPADDGVTEGFEGFNVGILDSAFVTIATSSNVTILDGAEAGKTFTLNSSTNTLTGTSGNDIFEGPYSGTSGMSFQSSDALDGGLGDDQLNVSVGAAGVHQASSLANIETVKGSFSATGTISLLGSTGVTTVKSSGSTANATFSNIDLGTKLEVENTAKDATFGFKTTAVTGTTDEATLSLSNVTAGTVAVAGIETLNVVSEGGGNVLTALTAANATTINVTGDQALNLGTANTVATMIDASAATAAVTLISDNAAATTVKGGSAKDSITFTGSNAAVETVDGGAGDDTITFTANLGAADVINGGEGTDTLVGLDADLAALTVPTTGALITNIEAVTFFDEYTTATTLANIQAGITTATFGRTGDNAANNAITEGAEGITGEAGSLTVNLGASAAGNAAALGGLLTINDTGTATDDSLTINNKSVNSTTGVNVDLNGSITSAGYETVSLNTGTGTGNVEQTIATFTITPDATTAAVSLAVAGNNAVDFSTAISTTSTGLLTVDASALKAQAAGTTTFDIASTVQGVGGTATITGSAGEDIIVVGNFASTISTGDGVDNVTGGTAADTIDGGAGNDVLAGGGGNDTIGGGDGNDAITASTAGNYTLTGGAGTDSFDLGGTLTQADKVDGGDGTDTLTINNDSVTAVNALSVSNINTLNANLNNVEVLNFGTTLAQNVDLGRLDNISSLILGNLAGGVVISGLAATNNVQIQATTGQTLGLALGDATGTSDVVNIELKNATATTVINANTITASNVETVNITSSDLSATTAEAADKNVMALVASKATTINVSGPDGLTLTNTSSTKVTTFDASGVVANDVTDTAANMAVTYTSANSSSIATVSITGGAGDDVLQGNVGIDTIVGGLGNDTITATAGNDVSTGGAGNDTFAFDEALLIANSGTTATYDGGDGTDILDFNEDAVINIVDADFRGITSVETLTTGDGVNNVVFGVNADTAGIKTVTGGTGADTLHFGSVDFDNALTIDTAGGADTITLSTSTDQVATVNIDTGDSGAASTDGLSATIAAADTLTFWTSSAQTLDIINGFTAGTDKIDFTNTGAAVTMIGTSKGDMAEDTIFFASGAYNATNGVFTLAADGTGADTLVFENEGTAAMDVAATATNMIVLVGVDSDDLVAGSFVQGKKKGNKDLFVNTQINKSNPC